MLATVTIEVGFETKEERLAKGRRKNDARAKAFDEPRLTPSLSSGFQTFHALIDIRRPTNMLEIVKRCRLLDWMDTPKVLSNVHYKMLERDSTTMVVTPLKTSKDVYQLKCKKHTDKITGISHSLTVTVQAISVPRLDDRDAFWPR